MLELVKNGDKQIVKQENDFRDRMAHYWGKKQKPIIEIITIALLWEALK